MWMWMWMRMGPRNGIGMVLVWFALAWAWGLDDGDHGPWQLGNGWKTPLTFTMREIRVRAPAGDWPGQAIANPPPHLFVDSRRNTTTAPPLPWETPLRSPQTPLSMQLLPTHLEIFAMTSSPGMCDFCNLQKELVLLQAGLPLRLGFELG